MKDPFMSECLLYYLKVNDVTYVGTADLPADIVLCGKGIYPRHAVFEYITKDNRDEGILGGTSLIVKRLQKVISHKMCHVTGKSVIVYLETKHGNTIHKIATEIN